LSLRSTFLRRISNHLTLPLSQVTQPTMPIDLNATKKTINTHRTHTRLNQQQIPQHNCLSTLIKQRVTKQQTTVTNLTLYVRGSKPNPVSYLQRLEPLTHD
jgi:hypothetical protein